MAERCQPQAHATTRRAAASRRPRRGAQILDAAQRLFERQGYAATTMAAIAAEAGVALKTVYLAFETKSGVLRALWNVTPARRRRRGAGRRAGLVPRDARGARSRAAAPPQRAQLARSGRSASRRVGEVIRSAAAADPEIAALWAAHPERVPREPARDRREPRREEGARGLDVDRAADILWTINHPNTWQLLVGERGWTADAVRAMGRRHARAASCSGRRVRAGSALARLGRRWTWSASSRLSAWQRW